MIILVVVLFVFSLLVLGGGVAFYVVRRAREASTRPPPPVAPPPRPAAATQPQPARVAAPFRWRYVMWPLVVLAISVVAAAYFYRLLPEPVGWRFAADGAADGFLARDLLLAILLVPQFVLTFAAAVIALVVSRVGLLMKAGPTPAGAEGLITPMSNMVVLPQVILCFAMLDIFSYNAYQVHLLKLWVFAVLAMLVGGVVLGVFFARAMRQARSTGK